jgi:hypothetical protein
MGWKARAIACVALAAGWCGAAQSGPVDFGGHRPSADARYVAQWSVDTADAGRKPFIVVDKKDAKLYVFAPGGRLLAATAVLLGSALGDHTEPGVGTRAQSGQLAPHERTTPAGRFITHPGRNLEGEAVVWVDYDSAFAIHRLRAGPAREQRAARLASATPHDNRVSLGCVVVPVAFYLEVIEPLLGRSRGVVYVLPETQPVRELFGAM